MNILDVTTMAWDGVKSRKFRFLLNIVGILIGCTAVTGLISVTQGLSYSVTNQLQIFGPQNIMILPGQISMSSGPTGFSQGKLTFKDLNTIEKVEYITIATPIIANTYVQYDVKGKTYRAQVFGITEDFQRINQNVEMAEGRGLVRSDSGIAIIGANVAHPKNLDNPVLGVGDRITVQTKVVDEIKTATYRIIGVLKATGASFGVSLDDSLAISIRDSQLLFNTGNQYTYIMAHADSINNVDAAQKALRDRLGRGYSIVTYESAKAAMDRVISSIEAVLGGIAAISLLVAGIGIINTMTVSVMERTKEIGTLKALGAKSREVLMVFLSESMFTGLLGGFLGAILGFTLSAIVGQIVGMYAPPSVILGAQVVLFAILTAVLSGLYPAWRAANLSPVEALRHE